MLVAKPQDRDSDASRSLMIILTANCDMRSPNHLFPQTQLINKRNEMVQ
jgi:hypothetical protein